MITIDGNPVVVHPDLGRDEVYLLNLETVVELYDMILTYPARCARIDGLTTNEDPDLDMDVGL